MDGEIAIIIVFKHVNIILNIFNSKNILWKHVKLLLDFCLFYWLIVFKVYYKYYLLIRDISIPPNTNLTLVVVYTQHNENVWEDSSAHELGRIWILKLDPAKPEPLSNQKTKHSTKLYSIDLVKSFSFICLLFFQYNLAITILSRDSPTNVPL